MRYDRWMRDTTDDAIAVRTRIYRAMTGARLCDLAAEMSMAARELAWRGSGHATPTTTLIKHGTHCCE
jgi:hypothetical protein